MAFTALNEEAWLQRSEDSFHAREWEIVSFPFPFAAVVESMAPIFELLQSRGIMVALFIRLYCRLESKETNIPLIWSPDIGVWNHSSSILSRWIKLEFPSPFYSKNCHYSILPSLFQWCSKLMYNWFSLYIKKKKLKRTFNKKCGACSTFREEILCNATVIACVANYSSSYS